MNVDSSVYDVNIEFGKLNCGDTFIYMGNLCIKANIMHPKTTGYLAIRICDGESRYVVDVETVKLVKTKAVRDND